MLPVRIAIIDSGVNPSHSHVGGVAGGVGFSLDEQGQVAESPDFLDEIGHGTAITGVIRAKSPTAQIYAAKIFPRVLRAPMSLLMAAMEWAIKENTKIIHLSLGTRDDRYMSDLERLCSAASRKGTIVVAAATRPDAAIYPAVFETVIGVYWNPECDEDSLVYHPGNPVEFGAHGWPRPIPGLPQELNLRGSSFAAAHVTGRIARLMEANPDATCGQMRKALASEARRQLLHA